jgi:hypothetical protein
MNYGWRVLKAISQLGNALIGGNPNMTLSARAYLARNRNPIPYRVFNTLFFWQDDHCKLSWESDIAFARKALEMLNEAA